MNKLSRFNDKFVSFFFPQESDYWLSILRVGLGLQLLLYSLSLKSDWRLLFTGNSNGLIGRDLTEALLDVRGAFIPRLGWLVSGANYLGIQEERILTIAWIALLGAALLLLVGFFCRPAAIVAWFLYLCAAKSGDLFSYGMDNFTIIGLFYLMIAPFPDQLSYDAVVRKTPPKNPCLQGFHRRVLQLHLCLIYFFGGVTKSLGAGWWNGNSIWRAMTCPPFNVIKPEVILSGRSLLPLIGIAVCLLELGYVFFIWPPRIRTWWLFAIIAMHLFIGIAMGLYLFSLIMIVLNLAGFAPAIEFSSRDANLSDCAAGVFPRPAKSSRR